MVFNTDAWAELSPDLQAICAAAASAAALEMQAQFDYHNAQAMQALADDGVEFLSFPDDVVTAMRSAWEAVREEMKGQSPDVARARELRCLFRQGPCL